MQRGPGGLEPQPPPNGEAKEKSMGSDARINVAESIEHAIANLSDALIELDRIPRYDKSLIGRVAHSMNNFLSVNEATLELISQLVRDHPNRELKTWLDGLNHLGKLMHHTVERLVRVSSPAEFPLKPDYINLAVLMERACDYYRGPAEQKQLRMVCRSVGDVPLAWADRVAVAVVADNLLSNAVKFSNPHGEIFVQIMAGPGGVVCGVRDHGSGLTPIEQAHLFERGATPRPVPTAGEASHGFGLLIAKDLIDRMGGRLWCESEPGQGACFSFRLPYHPAPLQLSGTSE